jgi:hypothetical protein
MPKNILIYTHMPHFNLGDGGTTVQYNLAKILDELNQVVRIYPSSGIMLENPIFNKFYKNDFPIDDNVVVIYCEGTPGNPLGVKNVVRWMLSVLGQNVPYDYLLTWGKNELVYHFNSEPRFYNFPERINVMYKMLTSLYVNPELKQTNFDTRSGICYTIRKAPYIHKSGYSYVHPKNSFKIHEQSQSECIEIFNKFKWFISYDSNTFLTHMAAMCGCISVVYKVNGLSKKDWLKTTAAAEYLKHTGLENLYGIAYGQEEMQYAMDTIHLARTQWDEIIDYCKKETIIPFINDINNFENMQNTIQNNYYV